MKTLYLFITDFYLPNLLFLKKSIFLCDGYIFSLRVFGAGLCWKSFGNWNRLPSDLFHPHAYWFPQRTPARLWAMTSFTKVILMFPQNIRFTHVFISSILRYRPYQLVLYWSLVLQLSTGILVKNWHQACHLPILSTKIILSKGLHNSV